MRLTLRGDLDYASVHGLENKLRELKQEAVPVRVNLSQIEFLDSGGLGSLITAVTQARRSGWKFEIERNVPASVEDRFRHTGLANLLDW